MSIWDKFTGRKPSEKSPSNTTSSTPSSNAADTFSPTPFDPQEAQDVSSFLTGPSFADPSQLHPLAGLNQQTLDYLSLEDSTLSDLPGAQSALPSRGWSDDLCYGTGVTYLTALTVGGAWGLQEGLRRSNGQPPKLRLNSVLNAVTRRGPFLGNSAAVIAMVYNGFNSFIGHMRGKHDSVNSIAAGALSGMIFKSTRGLRPMMISGGIVASVAGAWAVSICRSWKYDFVLIICLAGRKKGCLLSSSPSITSSPSTFPKHPLIISARPFPTVRCTSNLFSFVIILDSLSAQDALAMDELSSGLWPTCTHTLI